MADQCKLHLDRCAEAYNRETAILVFFNVWRAEFGQLFCAKPIKSLHDRLLTQQDCRVPNVLSKIDIW